MKEKIKKFWYPIGHFNENQRDFFIELLTKLKPKTILEIGWASGRSCVTALIAGNPEKMISIEIDLDSVGARKYSKTIIENFPNLKIIEDDSKKVLKKSFFKKEFPNGLDFSFIDGDHTYNGAYDDIKLIYPYINKGGIIVIDDYCSSEPDGCPIPDVTNAVNDFIRKNKIEFDVWNKNGKGFAIIKK
jgi:predicted O-methyltransferase YrrM